MWRRTLPRLCSEALKSKSTPASSSTAAPPAAAAPAPATAASASKDAATTSQDSAAATVKDEDLSPEEIYDRATPIPMPQKAPSFPLVTQHDMRPLMAIENTKEAWTRRALLALIGSVIGIIALDIDSKVWSSRHTWSTAFNQYVLFKVMGVVGRWRLRKLLEDVEQGEEVQRKLLSELLQRHQGTDWGRENGLVGVSTMEEFRKVHPITRHSNYSEYIGRVRGGKENVLAPGLPKLLAMTSGTSGRPNLLPHTADVSKNFFVRGVCTAFGVLEAEYPGAVTNLQRSSKLCFRASRQKLPESGLEIGSNSSSPDDQGFQRLLCAYASPLAAYSIRHEPDALYAHALFALKDRNLGQLEANFAPLLCMLLETARANRKSLVQDIRNGHIWDRRVNTMIYSEGEARPDEANMELRDAVDVALGGPDPRRAEEVDDLLKRGATASEIWPRLRVVMTSDGGAFAPSAARLRELLGERVPIYSPFYAATEGLLGINVFPQRPFGVSMYVLDPGSMFFELLPIGYRDVEDVPRDATVLPWEAEVGASYEVIITTRGGLCRYRLGDIVRVHGRFGEMPVVSVVERATHFLPPLHGERVSEGVFLAALSKLPLATRLRGAVVVDLPGKLSGSRYHVFVEMAPRSDGGGDDLKAVGLSGKADIEREAAALDEALCEEHDVYASFRRKDAIRRLQLHVVRPGTFAALRPKLASRSGVAELPPVGSGQVKCPTVFRGELAEQLLAAAMTS
eukprot:TRINITY_DN44814_c0_g1_i1.p1 TRINITY_DN44814_c0_g1~~TRINITY_DN44814_c0_g1_i1.p1  ORF type:complete len:739 (-),score=172.44 TRINITY_DN44814_c0_g1_i1:97-2313(-)